MLSEEKTPDRELGLILSRNLYRVPAPEELWLRIQDPRPAGSPAISAGNRLLVAVALSVGVLACGFLAIRVLNAANPILKEAFAGAAGNVEFQSNQPARIRQWVNAQAGIDIPLSAAPPSTVQLIGASVRRGASPEAAVAYRVNNRDAVLLVAKSDTALRYGAGHGPITSKQVKDLQVSSWTMRGHSYTLAYAASGDLRGACGICHSDGEPLTALN